MHTMENKILALDGPIMVMGASGFIGSNILRSLLAYRDDVFGTTRDASSWRLEGIPYKNIFIGDTGYVGSIIVHSSIKTVFDCIAYGSYPFQTDRFKIFKTNSYDKYTMLERLRRKPLTYIHAGSSSEYGSNSAGPNEDAPAWPNSHYAESKKTFSNLLSKHFHKMRCANLRLYSVYGPYEDGSRLIPQVIQCGLRGKYPPFVRPDITRDFIYVDDVVESFVDAANNLKPEDYGGSFNIGRGIPTRIEDIGHIAQSMFGLDWDAHYDMKEREWDHSNAWYANTAKARDRIGWEHKMDIGDGLNKTRKWYEHKQMMQSIFERYYNVPWQWPSLATQEKGNA